MQRLLDPPEVVLIGPPNVGKSTLTNALVGAKVSIVTHKAQTTRGPVRGLALVGDTQIILVDTPGIFEPKRKLDRAMSNAAWDRAGDADIVALVIDAKRGLDAKLNALLEHLPRIKRPTIAILNKIDLVAKPDLLRLTAELSDLKVFDQVFMISALTGDGVPELKTFLAGAVPPGPWLFPEDQLSDASLRQTAAEITREKLFLRLHEELPAGLQVPPPEVLNFAGQDMDFDALIGELGEAGVEFIIVGGLAATIHGSSRLTQDIDAVYARSDENIERLVTALRAHEPTSGALRQTCRLSGRVPQFEGVSTSHSRRRSATSICSVR